MCASWLSLIALKAVIIAQAFVLPSNVRSSSLMPLMISSNAENDILAAIAALESKITGQITDLKQELTGQVTDLKQDLTGQYTDLKAEMEERHELRRHLSAHSRHSAS
jgi:conjugal transfer/entry exclusion protein